MKKLTALILSLAMLCALAVPAFADGPDGPPDGRTVEAEWEALCAEQPEETARFLEEFPEWFAENYDWYEGSFEQFSQSFFQGKEAAYVALFKEWSYDPAQEWADVCAGKPEQTAQFLAELDTWFAKNYPSYDSFEAFAEDWGGKEAAYAVLFGAWSQEREQAKLIEDAITGHGGVPGQINVMLNGTCVKFSDAAPEMANGRTMVPFRAILEALGAEVEYGGNDDISCTANGYKYTFAVGSDKVTVRPTADNDKDVPQPEDIVMDCAPYVKNDRTYIPVRFISEALGYEVGWDSEYRTVVLIDREALAEKIDQNFTVLNKVMASQGIPETAQQTTGSVTANITLFDSINGDTTKTLTGSIDGVVSPAGLSMKMDYDFSALWELIEGYIAVPLMEGELYDQYKEQIELMKGMMSGTWEIRVDAEKGTYYYAMPIMNKMLRQQGVDIADDAWLSLDMAALYEEIAADIDIPTASTIGELFSCVLASSGADDFQAYDAVMEVAGITAKVAGDSKFTRDGTTQTLTLTKADLEALTEGVDLQGLTWDALRKFSLTLKLEDNGDAEVDLQCTIAMNNGITDLGDVASFSLKSTQKGGKTESTMECHIKNTVKITMESTQTTAPTDKAPQTTPPEGAAVVPMEELTPAVDDVSPLAAVAGLLRLAA